MTYIHGGFKSYRLRHCPKIGHSLSTLSAGSFGFLGPVHVPRFSPVSRLHTVVRGQVVNCPCACLQFIKNQLLSPCKGARG